MLFKSKKGAGLTDLFVFMVYALILAVVCGMFVYLGNITEEKFLEQEPVLQKGIENQTNITTLIKGTIGQVNVAYTSLKWITAMLLIGMAIAIIISGYLVTIKSPVYFVPYSLIVILAVIIAAPVSNVYETLMADATLGSTFTEFSGQTFIFLYLPYWMAVIGIIAGVVMYIGMKKYKAGIGDY